MRTVLILVEIEDRMQEAGRDLDALVAEKVMGYQWFPVRGNDEQRALALTATQTLDLRIGAFLTDLVPHYSTDFTAAWWVVAKVGLTVAPYDDKWIAATGWWFPSSFEIDGLKFAVADTVPLAICLAALKTVDSLEQ